MDMSALSDELTNDPLGRGYSGMDDATAAASLNAVDRPSTRPVEAPDQRMWLAQGGRHEKLAQGIASGADDVAKGLCRSALLMATNDDAYKREDHKTLLDALVTYTILSQADADALDGLADITVSRAVELNLGRVRSGTIAEARAE